MIEKVYITKNQKANFACPVCQISKTVDVSKYIKSDKKVKINAKCPCGHTFTSFLERRKHYRKETNLPGSFVRYVAGKPAGRANAVVRDLSSTGMGLEVNENSKLSEGDVLEIQFRLDDPKSTLITTKVVIKTIENLYIGAEFLRNEIKKNRLGFYLMP